MENKENEEDKKANLIKMLKENDDLRAENEELRKEIMEIKEKLKLVLNNDFKNP